MWTTSQGGEGQECFQSPFFFLCMEEVGVGEGCAWRLAASVPGDGGRTLDVIPGSPLWSMFPGDCLSSFSGSEMLISLLQG